MKLKILEEFRICKLVNWKKHAVEINCKLVGKFETILLMFLNDILGQNIPFLVKDGDC